MFLQIRSSTNQLGTAYVTDRFTWWIFVSHSNSCKHFFSHLGTAYGADKKAEILFLH